MSGHAPTGSSDITVAVNAALDHACHDRVPFALRQIAALVGRDGDVDLIGAIERQEQANRLAYERERLRERHERRCRPCRSHSERLDARVRTILSDQVSGERR